MGASHALAVALDDFLSLSSPAFAERRLIEEYYREHRLDGLPPAVAALARLRWEAEREVDRLIALLDAIDGDPDLEPCDDDCGHEDDAARVFGFEPNLASTETEDATGRYADQGVGVWDASQIEECEDVCEDEGAWDEREQDHRSDDERKRVARRRAAAAKRRAAAHGLPILRHASF